ncbi:STAS domain-containing protein [Catellatospora sp. NPDC049609]|uniref:STAS domain-containing protein n=1 Tax=Catellatospora sp. NPDC049609 TaxID=3155505 RepID=UPI003429E0B0
MDDTVAVTTAQAVPLVEVQVKGVLDAHAAPGVNHLLEEALVLRPRQIVVDLTECEAIDAAGILLLLDAHRRAARDGGTVALRSPNARARRSLRLARVDRILQILPLRTADVPLQGPVVL